jgi:hypothetical protein
MKRPTHTTTTDPPSLSRSRVGGSAIPLPVGAACLPACLPARSAAIAAIAGGTKQRTHQREPTHTARGRAGHRAVLVRAQFDLPFPYWGLSPLGVCSDRSGMTRNEKGEPSHSAINDCFAAGWLGPWPGGQRSRGATNQRTNQPTNDPTPQPRC